MANQDKLDRLIDSTLRKSRQGELNWSESPGEEVYTVVTNNGKYILKAFGFTETSMDGIPSLSVFSSENQMLIDVVAQGNLVRREKLAEIFELARDKATGVGDALEEVLKELEG